MNYSTRTATQQQRHIAKHAQESDADQFFHLLTSPELLDSVDAHLPEHRESKYPPTLVLAMFMGQAMNSDRSCQKVVNEANVSRVMSGLSSASSSTGAYCLARQRLPLQMVRSLAQQTGELLVSQSPDQWHWRGRPVKLVDGTTITMPDTRDNQEHYPQHGTQAPGAGFPIARLVGVTSLSTGAILNAAMAPNTGKGTGEHSLFREIRDVFSKGDMMLGDSYYCSYFLIADLLERGVDGLFEQHGARKTDFRRGKKLGERDHVVRWKKPARPAWMSREEYKGYPAELTVREVRVKKKVLVTTMTKRREVSKKALGDLFLQRWHVELDLRSIKSTLGMDVLSCKTAAMCEKEMWVYFLAYNLIRLLMAEAAYRVGVLPRELSFKHTLQIWVAWSQRQSSSLRAENTAELFSMIAQVRVGKRPGRIEPRAMKKRPKPYRYMKKIRHEERESIKRRGHGKKLAA